jgi:hypothetical protein
MSGIQLGASESGLAGFHPKPTVGAFLKILAPATKVQHRH